MVDVQQLYQHRFQGMDAYRNRVWQALIKGYFGRVVPSDSVVLDLGAGYCEFINNIACSKKYALDLNPDTRTYAATDVEVLLGDCSQPWPLAQESVDVIFTSNFFEHLPDKEALSRTLALAYTHLRPGGLLIALGPNVKYRPGAYWDFWDHYIPLTEYSLAEGMVQQGFTIEKMIDKFLPYTMVGGPQYPTFFVSLYLRLPLAWRIFGKQFLVVARKPA